MLSISIDNIFNRLAKLSKDPDLTEGFGLTEKLLLYVTLLYTLAGVLWGLMYIALGQVVAGIVPLSLVVFTVPNLIFFFYQRNYSLLVNMQLILVLILPFTMHMFLGGFVSSSAVVLWSFSSPLLALLLLPTDKSRPWFLTFTLTVFISGLIEPYITPVDPMPELYIRVFFVMNLVGFLGIVFTMMAYASSQKDQTYFLLHAERAKAETLLLNILPSEIADRLKEGTQRVADAYDSASVLFADIAGFTNLTEELSPDEMLELLNQVYSHFDTLVLKHGVEKIRTIGDNYMVASGVPTPRPDHAQALAAMALDMLDYCQTVQLKVPISFRIGINSGPMTAGIVGTRKFQYDVWGDAVNVASRMESSGVPNKCQVSTATYEIIKDAFECERRGLVNIKGKGEMETWFLLGRK